MGGLAKSGLIPKDTTEGKLLAAQSELADLRNQENELLLEIGKAAYELNPGEWPQDEKLKLIRANIASAQGALDEAKAAQEQAEAAKAAEQQAREAANARRNCPGCGHQNPEGTKFCRECGAKLGGSPKYCAACGAELMAGTRFCGECGAAQNA
jgi:hypothetical protein